MQELIKKYVGKNGFLKLGGLEVRVLILDVKRSYGRERFLVEAVAGKGKIWTEKVIIDKE